MTKYNIKLFSVESKQAKMMKMFYNIYNTLKL